MISTHILDTQTGNPATAVKVLLEKQNGSDWENIESSETNEDGRIAFDCSPNAGVYRLTFETEAYFERNSQEFFFPVVPIIFKISDTNRKYHVPLLLNPYGFTTYRGS